TDSLRSRLGVQNVEVVTYPMYDPLGAGADAKGIVLLRVPETGPATYQTWFTKPAKFEFDQAKALDSLQERSGTGNQEGSREQQSGKTSADLTLAEREYFGVTADTSGERPALEPASGEGTIRERKPLEMRGGDLQERYWEQLSDRRKAALTERFSEGQLFDPKPPEVMGSFLNEVTRLCSVWHDLTGPRRLRELQTALD